MPGTFIPGVQSLAAVPPSGRLIVGFLPLHAAQSPAAVARNFLVGAMLVHRIGLYGRGFVEGDTALKALPSNLLVSRRVLMFRERDGACFGERWSAPTTGYFRFENAELGVPYTIVVYDGPRIFKAAVQDAVLAERMT